MKLLPWWMFVGGSILIILVKFTNEDIYTSYFFIFALSLLTWILHDIME